MVKTLDEDRSLGTYPIEQTRQWLPPVPTKSSVQGRVQLVEMGVGEPMEARAAKWIHETSSGLAVCARKGLVVSIEYRCKDTETDVITTTTQGLTRKHLDDRHFLTAVAMTGRVAMFGTQTWSYTTGFGKAMRRLKRLAGGYNDPTEACAPALTIDWFIHAGALNYNALINFASLVNVMKVDHAKALTAPRHSNGHTFMPTALRADMPVIEELTTRLLVGHPQRKVETYAT